MKKRAWINEVAVLALAAAAVFATFAVLPMSFSAAAAPAKSAKAKYFEVVAAASVPESPAVSKGGMPRAAGLRKGGSFAVLGEKISAGLRPRPSDFAAALGISAAAAEVGVPYPAAYSTGGTQLAGGWGIESPAYLATDGAQYNFLELPKLLESAKIKYPQKLKDQGREGLVELLVEIDARGRVEVAGVKSSTHPLFTKAAVEAVSRFRYEPPSELGEDGRARFILPVPFKILDL